MSIEKDIEAIEADIPKLSANETSELHEAIKFWNWFVIWGGFLFWAFQIIRSAYLHHKRQGESEHKLWMQMHFLLFIANFCYLWYELQYAYIPLYFFMIFCTDVVGIWGLYLLTKGAGGEVEQNHLKWFRICTAILFVILIFSVAIPEHGMKCHPGHYPEGLSIIVVFYIFWSIFVCNALRKDKFLKVNDPQAPDNEQAMEQEESEAAAAVAANPKHQRKLEMVKKQKTNFMLNTIACLISQIALVLYSMVSMIITDEFDATFRGACYDGGWTFKDSGVILILTNILISLPIWQFIECFYSIPCEFGYFDTDNEDDFEKQENGDVIKETKESIENNDDFQQLTDGNAFAAEGSMD